MNKLLIVDDEEDVREFAASFFRKRKINVLTASSGQEAISIFEKERPHLVLLDIKMQGLDGIETLRQLKEKFKDPKVIMVTGKEPQEDNVLKICQDLGVLDYIHKPLELDKLEQIVIKNLK